MRVLLLSPPQWTTAQPSFALASLAGQLDRAGHQVVVRDLNLELVESILSPGGMRLAARRLSSAQELLPLELGLRLGTRDASDNAGLAALRLEVLERWSAAHGGELPTLTERALAAAPELRTADGFYDPFRYIASNAAIDDALQLFSLPFYPSELRWNHFAHPHVPLNLAPVVAFAKSRTDNPFRAFYQERLDELLEEEPGLVAISVTAFSQVLPGLTLASLLREAVGARGGRAPHLSLGGNFFSRLQEKLLQLPGFFTEFADSVTIGEGERPLVTLAEVLERGGALSEVPSLLYLDGAAVASTPSAPNFQLASLAHQRLDGFPLERYLAPERVLCVRASKGCYYAQCTFCDAHHGLQPDAVGPERLVAELAHLKECYGVTHFEMVDQCIAPAYLDAMSDALIAADLGVSWFFNARTEPGFTPGLMEKAKRAGATMVMWGLESGSPRLLKMMRKGVASERRFEVLKASANAGLFNFAYVFFGFPTETRAEAEATMELIHGHPDLIHAYGRSVFSLGRHSPLMQDPKRYGVLGWVEDGEELSTNLSFQLEDGLQGAELAAVLEECTARGRAALGEPLWMTLRSREALHLYLARFGSDFVRAYRLDQGTRDAEFVF